MNKLYPWVLLLIRFLLGVIFIYASLDKIIDPGKFARDIVNYHIVLTFSDLTRKITIQAAS